MERIAGDDDEDDDFDVVDQCPEFSNDMRFKQAFQWNFCNVYAMPICQCKYRDLVCKLMQIDLII